MEVLAIPRVGAAPCSGQSLASPASGTVPYPLWRLGKGGGGGKGVSEWQFFVQYPHVNIFV